MFNETYMHIDKKCEVMTIVARSYKAHNNQN